MNNKLINWLFQKGVFLIVLIVFIMFNIFSKFEGLNKTIGWGWNLFNDLLFISPYIYIFLFYLFLVVYASLTITKKETNKFYSILHLVIISVSAFILENYHWEILLFLNLISSSVFLLNVYWSLKKVEKKKLEVQ
jgi:hypothetical protein